MTPFTWQPLRWLLGLALACASLFLAPAAGAQTLTTGVDFDGAQATLWLRSSSTLAWVDAHYSVNNGAQQNLRMNYNAAATRFEVRFPAQSGQTVNHGFTYNTGSASFDSPPGSSQVGGSGLQPPSFNPPAGSYATAQSVSLGSAPQGLAIRFTQDGSPPTAASPLYSGPIAVGASQTLKAVAVAPDGSLSPVASASYVIGGDGGPNQGAEQVSGGVLLWLSGAGVQWVDLHVDSGSGPQNVRMALNAGAGRHEFRVTAANGSTVRYSFTYYTTVARDTAQTTVVVNPDDGSTAATPSITPPGGSFSSAQTVTLASATVGASIRYTLDGSTPGTGSALYTAPLSLSSHATLKAIAFAVGKNPSTVASASFSFGGGLSQGGVDASGGAVLWFNAGSTVDWVDLHVNAGSGPQNLRMRYNAGAARHEAFVAAASGSTLNYSFTYYRPSVGAADTGAYSYRVGGDGGCTGSVATPSFTPPAGSYSTAQSVVLASSTAGAEVRYTVDGSPPSASSPLYSGAIAVNAHATLKAIALKGCMAPSPVASAVYQIGGGGGYARGVSELGASATIWFQPAATMEYVIVHYALGNASEDGPQMAHNAAVGRWEFTVAPTRPGAVLNYWFTYKALGGVQLDSPRYALTLGGGLAGPVFSPAPGTYATAQQVTLANAPGVSGVIRYSTDGMAPTQQSPLYSAPLNVDRSKTIYATTFTLDGQSKTTMGNYVIGLTGGQVAAPVISHASGSYGTRLRVNLLSDTVGATLRYTLDGSTPTLNSLQYGGPIDVDASLTLKAAAFKPGMTASEVATASYTLTGTGTSDALWNGQTTFNVVNATRGRWADEQVYWSIIGKDWATGQFVHVGANGQLIPMALGDNGALMKNGLGYTNYFFRLDQQRSITLPPINSARILFSVGSPMYIQVNRDVNGQIGYAGANIENPSDPNIDVTFDFGEFAILPPGANPQGIFINTTRVDQFGFPLKLDVTGLDGFKQTVGESLTETRDELFAKFFAETPAEFHSLGQPPYGPMRIMAPAHATFYGEGAHANYLDAGIEAFWQQVAAQDLVIDLKNGWAPFTGRVVGGRLRFTDAAGGQYFVNAKPSTSMVMLGNGRLDDPSGGTTDVGKQLQLQAQVCAALNRQVAHLPFSEWWNGIRFFPADRPSNAFVKFWHEHSLNALAYGFAYDDVGGFSPSIHTRAPQTVTYTIGW